MRLNLAKLLDRPGESLAFETQADLSDLVFGSCAPADEPVAFKGEIRNTAGVLILNGRLKSTLHCICDRCLKPFEKELDQPVEAVLTTEIQDEEAADAWTFLLDGEEADLDEILDAAFVLNMDSQLLCREDCKGLCSRCGKDLNEGPCGCKKEIDPRLAVLAQLLEK
ncbi:MAG: DUF177 domain-containing protein [Oscillospiraceae bacterium]|nr:DUF177 domain-containing protein [Oscillospiraceae bacterium]